MSSRSDHIQEICTRFNEIQWHDSQLVALEVAPKGENRYDVNIDLRLLVNPRPGQYNRRAARLEIQDCRINELTVDTLGIRLTGGDIANAFCERGPALIERLESRAFDLPQPEEPFLDIVLFRIVLIPPGGEVNVFAKNFALTESHS